MDRVMFHDVPAEPEWQAWREWLRYHGVDPSDVVLPGWIERNEEYFQIVYTTSFRGRKRPRGVIDAGPVTWRVIQLDAPPLPFPESGKAELTKPHEQLDEMRARLRALELQLQRIEGWEPT